MTMDEIIEALQKKEVISLRNHLWVQSWLKKDTPLRKSPRRLKLIHQLKKVNIHLLDLRKKTS